MFCLGHWKDDRQLVRCLWSIICLNINVCVIRKVTLVSNVQYLNINVEINYYEMYMCQSMCGSVNTTTVKRLFNANRLCYIFVLFHNP